MVRTTLVVSKGVLLETTAHKTILFVHTLHIITKSRPRTWGVVVVDFVLSVCFGLVFQDTISLCSCGWPGTHRAQPAIASRRPG